MKKQDIKSQLQKKEIERHEAVAMLRVFGGSAKERRREVQGWIYEINPPKSLNDIREDYLNRRISRNTALVQLGRLQDKPKDTLFNTLASWKAERKAATA